MLQKKIRKIPFGFVIRHLCSCQFFNVMKSPHSGQFTGLSTHFPWQGEMSSSASNVVGQWEDLVVTLSLKPVWENDDVFIVKVNR